MASPESYKRWGEDYGLEFVSFDDLTPNFGTHYATVSAVEDWLNCLIDLME